MAGADYVCCETCGSKIVYSPEHQPRAVCGECYDTLKAKADLFDEMVVCLLDYSVCSPCQNGCYADDTACISNRAKVILDKAKALK